MSAPNKSYDPVAVAALAPDEVARCRDEALAAIAVAGDLEELKKTRLAHAGDRSPLALANREIGALPPAARADAGKRVGQARRAVAEALKAREAELEEERDQRVLVEEAVDVTLPTGRVPRGARHPLTTIQERMVDVFIGLGFEVAEVREAEAEAEWFNFDALNMGPDHPARSMQDTFFVESEDSGLVLRTHASPGQVRALLSRPLPVYVVIPTKCFRADEPDATHSPVFHQIDVLVVDEGIGMADLRGGIDAFVGGMFGAGLKTRFRPSYFPFTEPSAEVDVQCLGCRGASAQAGAAPCRTCKSVGWIELGGCGVVNPRVLVAAGVDADRYSGWAFGIGVERTLMFRHDIRDMRDMVEGDIRFTLPFGMEV
jgi:phenylalanyl-tRNA synthetase alpha chain